MVSCTCSRSEELYDITKVDTTVILLFLLLRNYVYCYDEIYLLHITYFRHRVEIFFPQSHHYQHTFLPPLSEKQHAGRVNLYAKESEIFTHAVFHLVILRKTSSSECIFQRARGWKTVGAESGL